MQMSLGKIQFRRYKTEPFLDIIPINRIIIPLLCILLGISNNLRNHFSTFVVERLKMLKDNEIEAISNTILAKIELQNFEDNFYDLKNEYNESKDTRINFNKIHKSKL